jgi:hypothetical protein
VLLGVVSVVLFFAFPRTAVSGTDRSISAAPQPISPVWLHEPGSNWHVGSYKLAKVRAQEELEHVSSPCVNPRCAVRLLC